MEKDRRTIEEIKERIDIVNLVDRYVKLKQAGRNFSGLCPFHQEKTGSFVVNPEMQRYMCFGCGESGDIFNFVQHVENIEFYDALKKLAKEAGIQLESQQRTSPNIWLEDLNEFATDFYEKTLLSPEGKHALKYLLDRGISKESIKQFRIGFAPMGNKLQNSVNRSFKQGLNKKQYDDSGLFVKKQGSYRDKFINRIMFPIWSVSGRVIGFSGRQTPGNDFGPKYLNTPATPLFYKSSVLLGIYQSKNNIRREDLAILCEGNLDVISAHQSGVANILAPMGTAITPKQIELVSRYTKNILFLFDSDKAGQQATEKGFKIAAKLGLNAYANNPEPYQDLDDLIQQAPKQVKKITTPTLDAFTYLLSKKAETLDISMLRDLTTLRNYVKNLLEDVADPGLRKFYLTKAQDLTKTDLSILLDYDGDNIPQVVQTETEGSSKKTDINVDRTEIRFLGLILSNSLFKGLQKINSKYFKTADIREIIEHIKSNTPEGVNDLLDNEVLTDYQKQIIELATFDASKDQFDNDPKKELNQMYTKIYNSHLEKRLNMVSRKLAIAEEKGDNKEISKLISISDKLRLLKQKKI